MIIPAAMFIESAVDTLKAVEQRWLDDQLKEFRCAMGAATCEKLGLEFPPTAGEQMAYNIGLQTARIILSGSPALVMKDINPADVL